MYKVELAKFGANSMTPKAEVLASEAQATMLESQLCRQLRKPKEQQSIVKYLGLYATVPPSKVHPTLWEAAQNAVGK